MSHPGGEKPPSVDSPAAQWELDAAKHALDELFCSAQQYRTAGEFLSLMAFVRRFRSYSPFNAMLVHIQMRGATYVAPASRWLRDYRRRIRAGARPLVILKPMGPVMFVFDVSDTVPEKDAPPLPREVTHPFEVRSGSVGNELSRTVLNARRDGVEVTERDAGSQSAGGIRRAEPGRTLGFEVPKRPTPEFVPVPLRYELLLNQKHSREARYATLAHELGHLYCGHLGTPDDRWWPDRRGSRDPVDEFEAESVCYLVCGRLGIDNPSDEYLAGHLVGCAVPPISLDSVMRAVGLVEQMGKGPLPPRKKAAES